MVLGVEWMQQLDEMFVNFKEQLVRFSKEGKTWELKGVKPKTMEVVSASTMDKAIYQNAKGWVIYVCQQEGDPLLYSGELPNPQIDTLCEQLCGISRRQDLPPKRTHDHHINLSPGTESVNLRPYRHPWEQKNAMEQMIKEMLKSGIIRNS